MTNEEAIFCLKGIKNIGHDIFTEQKDFQECLDMAIKALRQEPCEDCVSRKAIDQNIYDYAKSNGLSYANMKNYILDTPSVTLTRKKGKWITKIKSDRRNDMWPTNPKCSECGGEPYYNNTIYNYKFCPYCGAEMDCVTHDDVFDNVVKEMTHEERVLIELTRDMPKEIGVLYIQSFQQDHGPFTDEAAEIIREYLSKE
jgi:hypothetical protein